MAKQPAVYILASKGNGTLYIGVTSNILQRMWQHRNDLAMGFTQQYRVHRLVFFRIAWKLKLIETDNPDWRDLLEAICE